jgi:hypothetical protein
MAVYTSDLLDKPDDLTAPIIIPSEKELFNNSNRLFDSVMERYSDQDIPKFLMTSSITAPLALKLCL